MVNQPGSDGSQENPLVADREAAQLALGDSGDQHGVRHASTWLDNRPWDLIRVAMMGLVPGSALTPRGHGT